MAPRIESSQAIVVLGGGLYPDGSLNDASLRRAMRGIILYKMGAAPLLVLLGEPHHGHVESEVRVKLAQDLGIPAGNLLTASTAHTTHEEALAVQNLLRPKGVRTILLVTDLSHMIRAQKVFERVGFEVFPAPTGDHPDPSGAPEDRLALMRSLAGEFCARVLYRLAGHL